MRYGVPVALLACVLALGACSDDQVRPAADETEATPTPAPAYDGNLEPAAAVLALVPEAARTLTVTDYDEVRDELGVGVPADEQEAAAFWARADAERPLLTPGLLRGQPGAGDVSWEAHFTDAAGTELGWVLAFREGATLPQVPGGEVDQDRRLVTSGTTTDPGTSWANDPELTELVGLPANATYVARDCVPEQGGVDLDELGSWSIQFEGGLVTARLGEGRQDLFIRMRMATDDAAFAKAYTGGVADPLTGRIGYVMTDPAVAARQALRHEVPFAACP